MPLRDLSIRLVILLTIALLMASCGWNDPQITAASEIRDILYDISVNFNFGNISGIMSHVHPDYLHKGMRDWGLRELWLDRMASYSLLSIDFISVQVDGNYALATMRMSFDSPSETLVLQEPGDSGDASYFFFDGDKWRLHGNRYYVR
ncbi:MAG: hypothetical protein U1B83_09810 [Candidatus Cloacimonadaceae bacterium]|nr:hypothetical protein [Candidatus Cloacimonadaceae bacterium]